MAITNLAGTTWVFDTSKPLTFDGIDGELTFYINYTTQGKDHQNVDRSYSGKTFWVILESDGHTRVRAAWSTTNNDQAIYNTRLDGNPWAWFYQNAFAITIHDGTDATNATLIAWLEANAKRDWESEPTTITYNGTETTIEAGQTATLACNGKKPLTDVVVVFGADGTITYNGTETAVSAGQTATMTCAGKKMLTDVVITV